MCYNVLCVVNMDFLCLIRDYIIVGIIVECVFDVLLFMCLCVVCCVEMV